MNQAFIDGQNLTLGTKQSESPWKIDLAKFRFYLKRKYKIEKAYYFIGYYIERYEPLYKAIKRNDYELIFREFTDESMSNKKGNVDTDIVFEMMRKIADREEVDKLFLVSGDGDYFRTVNYLISKGKFGKVLAPEEKAMSSLYKRRLEPRYYAFLGRQEMRNKLKR